jgi:catechol 2,3-dioxygenase-like lactoylglutathione lyase family enzyme
MLRAAAGSVVLAALLVQPAAPRPPVFGLAHVRIRTSDVRQAVRFYGDLLGLPQAPQAAPNVALFYVNDRQTIIVIGSPGEGDDRFANVAWETPDLAAMSRYLASKGLTPAEKDEPGQARGRMLEMDDPDGHHVRVIQLSGAANELVERSDRRISKRILHAGLTIRDAAAADRFYKDVLGFSEIWRGGRPEGVTSWINMRVPEGTDYLEYMLTTTPPDRRQLGTAHHIALLVPDIQAALEAVRARTANDDPNHRAVPQIGVNRRWQLNVYDPDGTRIEFMEPWTAR